MEIGSKISQNSETGNGPFPTFIFLLSLPREFFHQEQRDGGERGHGRILQTREGFHFQDTLEQSGVHILGHVTTKNFPWEMPSVALPSKFPLILPGEIILNENRLGETQSCLEESPSCKLTLPWSWLGRGQELHDGYRLLFSPGTFLYCPLGNTLTVTLRFTKGQ